MGKDSVKVKQDDATHINRRKLLKNLAAGTGAVAITTMLPGKWIKPIARIGVLPAHAQTSDPIVQFRIILDTNGVGAISPTDWTGSTTVQLSAADDDAAYERWAVYFVGDTSGLPAIVPVTVTTAFGSLTFNIWTSNPGESVTVNFPRSGGGTVGASGTALDTGTNPRPLIRGYSGQSGTLTLEASGVQTMIVTIQGNN